MHECIQGLLAVPMQMRLRVLGNCIFRASISFRSLRPQHSRTHALGRGGHRGWLHVSPPRSKTLAPARPSRVRACQRQSRMGRGVRSRQRPCFAVWTLTRAGVAVAGSRMPLAHPCFCKVCTSSMCMYLLFYGVGIS